MVKPETWPSVEEIEAQVKSTTKKQHPKELCLLEKLLNSYLAGFGCIGSFTLQPDKEKERAWLMLTTRSFNSMRCAYDLLQRGYYSQAIMLIRSVNEDWLTCMDCLSNQDTLDALLHGKGRLGKGKLSYKNMAERLEVEQEWYGIYGEHSQFAHARQRAISVLVDPSSHTLRLGGHYDRDLFIASCYSLVPVAIRMTEFLVRVIGSEAKRWSRKTLPIIREAKAWMKDIEAEVLESGET